MLVLKFLDFTYFTSDIKLFLEMSSDSDKFDTIRFKFDSVYPDLVIRSDAFSINFCCRLYNRLVDLYDIQMKYGYIGHEIILENLFDELFKEDFFS